LGLDLLLPIALYAETHFRFWGCSPSLLFRKEPEVIFDLPRRLVPRYNHLPLALILNDIRRYPVQIESIQITLSQNGEKPKILTFDKDEIQKSLLDHPLKNQMSAYILNIPRTEFASGELFVNACLKYHRIKKGRVDKRIATVLNDNLVTSTKLPFRCIIADEEYPGYEQCGFGDVHSHSQFSRSHVEFGPPIEMIDKICAVCGLNFAAVTDHSYDLACLPDDYLHQDKDLGLWKMFQAEISNFKGEIVIIPGEEISVVNHRGDVVHLCGLGISEYIPGTLDGARKNVHFKKQLTIKEAVDEINRQGGVSFAAHPGAPAGLLQRLFLGRGIWEEQDMIDGLGGIQAVNSDFFESWKRGKNLWITMLQKGYRLPILAGSDAHGDFNRYRAVGKPFWQIYEGAERYMGFVRTGVYGNPKDIKESKDIIDGIKNGAAFLTNGPFVSICDSRFPKESLISLKPISADNINNLCVCAKSTKEFGTINTVKVFMGIPGVNEEKIILKHISEPDTYDVNLPIPSEMLTEKCYLRIEAEGKTPRGLPAVAVSSACFIGY